MKPTLFRIILPLFFFGIFGNIYGQVKTKMFYDGVPDQFLPVRKIAVEKRIIAPNEFLNLLDTDPSLQESPSEYLGPFAFPVEVNINLLDESNILERGDEFTIYAITVIAEKALNISLQFSEFQLSNLAVLSIFTRHEITDNITSAENNDNKVWGTRVYQGGDMTIVLKIPTFEKEKSTLKVERINFGYRAFGTSFFGNPGASAPCNINVNCPQGNDWGNERNSVALIVANGNTVCTGTLVMNTCGTNIPYLLTANHCLPVGNVSNWVFQFQTWSAVCLGNIGWVEDIQFNGSQLRANHEPTDFALLQLNQTPPSNSGITYAGWDRTNIAAAAGAGLHHPRGDLMKVSLFNEPVMPVSYGGGPLDHWRVSFDQGIVQHGSSGSALFNQNHRIVGQLHGNQNNVCGIPGTINCWCNIQIPSIGEYGRFDLSWNGGGANSNRLRNWLDPCNTGATTTNTTGIACLAAPGGFSLLGPSPLCTSGTYSFNQAPAGSNIAWSVSPTWAATISGSGASVTVTRNSSYSGNATLTATVTANCGTFNVSRTINVGQPISISWQGAGPYGQLDVTVNGGSAPYKFYKNGSLIHTSSLSFVTIPFGCDGGLLKVEASTSCGVSSTSELIPPGCASFTIYPNPASEILMVSKNIYNTQESLEGDGNSMHAFVLHDFNGGIVMEGFLSDKESQIDVSKLKKGQYVLKINLGINNMYETHHIIVDR